MAWQNHSKGVVIHQSKFKIGESYSQTSPLQPRVKALQFFAALFRTYPTQHQLELCKMVIRKSFTHQFGIFVGTDCAGGR